MRRQPIDEPKQTLEEQIARGVKSDDFKSSASDVVTLVKVIKWIAIIGGVCLVFIRWLV